jgi:hypothetical protein
VATVKDMWAKKDRFSRSASEISRTLCLSGLAVVWIFRTPTANGSTLSPWLIWVAGMIVLALLIDLLQYVVGTVQTGRVARARELQLAERALPPDTEVKYPQSHPKIIARFWWGKILIVVVAWSILLVFVVIKAVTSTLPAISH